MHNLSIDDIRPRLEEARLAPTLLGVGKAAAAVVQEYYRTGAGLVLVPITDGGIIIEGSPSHRANIRLLGKKISELSEHNEEHIPIFDQLIFKPFIDKHRLIWESKKTHMGVYYHHILSEFYQPILDTGLIMVGFFGHGWERSTSCKYVHRFLDKKERKTIVLQ